MHAWTDKIMKKNCKNCLIDMELKFEGEYFKPSEKQFQESDPTMEIWQCPKCKDILIVKR